MKKMLKKDLEKKVLELEAKLAAKESKASAPTPKKVQKRFLLLNTKATKESLHKALMALVFGSVPTKKVSRELMDKNIEMLLSYLTSQGLIKAERNFHDIPEKDRPKNFSPKFSTYIYTVYK